ncbi:MAG: hypothetical protein R3309_11960, partial [Reinekea sp.]|nr:hypothetical protein [Reinekea sp.]
MLNFLDDSPGEPKKPDQPQKNDGVTTDPQADAAPQIAETESPEVDTSSTDGTTSPQSVEESQIELYKQKIEGLEHRIGYLERIVKIS